MAIRRRPHRLYFYVSDEEKEIIEENIERTKAGNLSNYLRQLALEGSVTHIDVSAIRALHRDLGYITRDLHQIVHRAALAKDLHEQDYIDIVADYEQIRSKVLEMMSRQMHSVNQASEIKRKKRNGNH